MRLTIGVSGPMDPMLVDAIYEACAWLDIEPPITTKLVVKARRHLARKHHPDVGGDAETMRRVNAAADFLLGWEG